MNKLALAVLLASGVIQAEAQEPIWEYKLERNPTDSQYIENSKGERNLIIRGEQNFTRPINTMYVSMISHGYFTEDNIGHIVLLHSANILKGDIPTGHGIIVGNVSLYDKNDGICKGNSRVNSVSVETFWDYGNCVYPDDIGLTFRDGVKYDIAITVNKHNNSVTTNVKDEYGFEYENTVMTHYNDIAKYGNSWVITEVMAKHQYSVYFTEPEFESSY